MEYRKLIIMWLEKLRVIDAKRRQLEQNTIKASFTAAELQELLYLLDDLLAVTEHEGAQQIGELSRLKRLNTYEAKLKRLNKEAQKKIDSGWAAGYSCGIDRAYKLMLEELEHGEKKG